MSKIEKWELRVDNPSDRLIGNTIRSFPGEIKAGEVSFTKKGSASEQTAHTLRYKFNGSDIGWFENPPTVKETLDFSPRGPILPPFGFDRMDLPFYREWGKWPQAKITQRAFEKFRQQLLDSLLEEFFPTTGRLSTAAPRSQYPHWGGVVAINWWEKEGSHLSIAIQNEDGSRGQQQLIQTSKDWLTGISDKSGINIAKKSFIVKEPELTAYDLDGQDFYRSVGDFEDYYPGIMYKKLLAAGMTEDEFKHWTEGFYLAASQDSSQSVNSMMLLIAPAIERYFGFRGYLNFRIQVSNLETAKYAEESWDNILNLS